MCGQSPVWAYFDKLSNGKAFCKEYKMSEGSKQNAFDLIEAVVEEGEGEVDNMEVLEEELELFYDCLEVLEEEEEET